MTQQTTNPEAEEDMRCNGVPSLISKFLCSNRFAKKYVGNCTDDPKPVRTMAGPTPLQRPRMPSAPYICLMPSAALRY